ncbi:MAG: hypothetical protein JWL95_3024, partial [Gemmatimonadetes bacterium]|nr:hypothetical protein [Gemmatimonadota bacterium]
MMRRMLLLAALALPLLADGASAQGGLRRQRLGPATTEPQRQQLEARLRQGLWRVAKNRIGFTDEQMSKLTQTSQRFDSRRRELALTERQQRLTLRSEILAGANANQTAIGTALDRLLQLQRARIDLQIDEQ